ncbi:cytosine methyltransferase [bacterium D16-76]|nr:cytosine methyltransferase [bacterium D16-76]
MDTNSKKYKTILADPPWKVSSQRGRSSNRSAESHYELMPIERIMAMPVADLCEENAHLYLWIPNGELQVGLDTIRAWGFTFRSPIYWIKPRLGLGNYVRNASETCLFATRGKAPVKFHAQPNWFFAVQQEHSRKPEEIFSIIQRLSDGPYLELFARRRQPGWDCWGFEAPGGSDLMMPGDYPVPTYSDKVIRPDKRKEV